MQNAAADVVKAGGGKVVGAVRVPLGTSDFASYLLQAQSSGAQVLGLANAGTDFSNSLKAANEFGITKTMKPAALLAFISDIHALGLDAAQGLYLTDRLVLGPQRQDPRLRQALLRQDPARADHHPGGYYSATLTYLNAVKAAGSTDPDKVMAELHKTKIDDMFTANGVIRADGLMEHDMYVMQVKTPAEFEGPVGLLQARPDDERRGGVRQAGRLRPARW